LSPAPAPAASASLPENLSLGARLAGVIRRPRVTFEGVAATPRPAPALAVLFFVPFAVFAMLYSTEVGRRALVDQWERTALAFGGDVDDARYAEFQQRSRRGVGYAALTSLGRGPGLALGLSFVLYSWFTAVRRGTASYDQVLGVVSHAGIILVLRDLVSAPLFYARESVAGATSLVRLVGGLDEASPVARFLAMIDPFVAWWLLVIAIGVGVLYKQQPRRVGLLLVGVYLGGTIVLAAVMAALGRT
jgi:hypothetical protein